MVKVTMDQIIAFSNNGDFFSSTTLPLKGAYKLNKIKKAVEKEGEFYREKFQEIVDTYAQKDSCNLFFHNSFSSFLYGFSRKS